MIHSCFLYGYNLMVCNIFIAICVVETIVMSVMVSIVCFFLAGCDMLILLYADFSRFNEVISVYF